MKRMVSLIIISLMAGLLFATVAQASPMALMNLGPGTIGGNSPGSTAIIAFPDISADGTLIGGNNTTIGGFIVSNGTKTVVGGTVRGVEYVGGVATAVGTNSSAASKWQGGSWSTLPLASGTTAWTPTGMGAGTTDWWISGYRGTYTTDAKGVYYQGSTNLTVDMALPPTLGAYSHYNAVSNNGKYVGVGQFKSGSSTSRNALASDGASSSWLAAFAGNPPTSESFGYNISSDGTTKVGWGWLDTSQSKYQATYWKATANTATLIPIPAGRDWQYGTAVDGDGTTFGGSLFDSGGTLIADGAWIWSIGDAQTTTVKAYLTGLGVDTTGWSFGWVTGMSDDGLSLVGTGTFNGTASIWAYSVVPEPATLTLLSLGGLFLRRRS